MLSCSVRLFLSFPFWPPQRTPPYQSQPNHPVCIVIRIIAIIIITPIRIWLSFEGRQKSKRHLVSGYLSTD
ncbi:hypothetical protein I7I50_05546 [Histoplasma capsulatum G186AR]|uniref:Uncharacterized protein n=1 Tax=Ajellomyces capsulatus TaxID=5037 RepID=A0A8H7ZCT9_AJECA|nr:hypothetical protein I7I52_03806 [Histoplasma capsulatum]QSS76180.1 hypothetical protein I7I50_05546 [Histoplasma capsulatum G186AR]